MEAILARPAGGDGLGEAGAEPKKGLCRVETKTIAKKSRDMGEASHKCTVLY
jgi:hypothetical protein